MDPACLYLTSVVAVDQSFQVRQLCGDAEATSYHKDTLISVHGSALAVRSAEQNQGVWGVEALRVMEEFTGEASAGLDKEIEGLLRRVGP